ncbi:hypothetical protein AWENTII_002351 [Aspergillus wentii]
MVTSNAIFDRVWNLVLLSLLLLTTLLFDFPSNGHTSHLSCLLFFDLILFLSLSPLQVLLFNRWAPYAKFDRLEIIHPKQKDQDDQTETQGEILADIVAVHGLGSDPNNAWRQGNCDWLRNLLPQERIPARIMAFNHNTSWESEALSKSIDDHANDLLRVLGMHRHTPKQKERPIIFIGHSFGGLIIKRALICSALVGEDENCYELYKQTKGLIFMGTPHRGANLTTAGKISSLFGYWKGSTVEPLELFEYGSAKNETLHKDFMRVVIKGCSVDNIVCVYENVKETLCGFMLAPVVERYSAVIDGSTEIAFETKHRGLQRFTSRNDENYQKILCYIRGWVHGEKVEVDESFNFFSLQHRLSV